MAFFRIAYFPLQMIFNFINLDSYKLISLKGFKILKKQII